MKIKKKNSSCLAISVFLSFVLYFFYFVNLNGQHSVDFFNDILFFGVFMAYHRLVIGLLRKDLISVKDTK